MVKVKRKIYIPIFIIAVLAVAYFYYMTRKPQAHQTCPDDYATSEDQMTALNKWTNDYYDNHPGASLSDWSSARLQYWEDNKCEKAIERYNEAKSGKANPETINFIKQTIINNN